MGEITRPTRRTVPTVVVIVLALVSLATQVPSAAATTFPPLPVALDATFLSNLSGADLGPGGQSALGFQVADPPTFAPMTAVVLTLDVYAFNAFPGNATSSIASAGTPVLLASNASGTWVECLPLFRVSGGSRRRVGRGGHFVQHSVRHVRRSNGALVHRERDPLPPGVPWVVLREPLGRGH